MSSTQDDHNVDEGGEVNELELLAEDDEGAVYVDDDENVDVEDGMDAEEEQGGDASQNESNNNQEEEVQNASDSKEENGSGDVNKTDSANLSWMEELWTLKDDDQKSKAATKEKRKKELTEKLSTEKSKDQKESGGTSTDKDPEKMEVSDKEAEKTTDKEETKTDKDDKEDDDKDDKWSQEQQLTSAVRNFVCIPNVYDGPVFTKSNFFNYEIVLSGLFYRSFDRLCTNRDWHTLFEGADMVKYIHENSWDSKTMTKHRHPLSQSAKILHRTNERKLMIAFNHGRGTRLMRNLLFQPFNCKVIHVVVNKFNGPAVSFNYQLEYMRRNPPSVTRGGDMKPSKEKCLFLQNLPANISGGLLSILFPCSLTQNVIKVSDDSASAVLGMETETVAYHNLIGYQDLVIGDRTIQMGTSTMTQEDAVIKEKEAAAKQKAQNDKMKKEQKEKDSKPNSKSNNSAAQSQRGRQSDSQRKDGNRDQRKDSDRDRRSNSNRDRRGDNSRSRDRWQDNRGPGPTRTQGYRQGAGFRREPYFNPRRDLDREMEMRMQLQQELQMTAQQELERVQLEKLRALEEIQLKQKAMLQEKLMLQKLREEAAQKSEQMFELERNRYSDRQQETDRDRNRSYNNYGEDSFGSGLSRYASSTPRSGLMGSTSMDYSGASMASRSSLSPKQSRWSYDREESKDDRYGQDVGSYRSGSNYVRDQTSGYWGTADSGSRGVSAGSNLKLNITDDEAGVLIGRGGSMIKKIRQESGAMIEICRGEPGSSGRAVTIQGTNAQTYDALSTMRRILDEKKKSYR